MTQMREGNLRTKVATPCAACRMLRRRCGDKCVLAPYFPPNDPEKFATVHRIFGASNVIRILQDVDNEHRDEAVRSMVYEARTRLRDPIYGCAGAICQLQQHVCDLQAQLATAQAQILNLHCQQANLLAFLTASNSSFGEGGEPADYDYDEPLDSSWTDSPASQVISCLLGDVMGNNISILDPSHHEDWQGPYLTAASWPGRAI